MKRTLHFALSATLAGGFAVAMALAADGPPVRVGGNVAQSNRISSVNPVYPVDAKRDRIQGTVKLEITIDKEGHVSQVSVIGGPSELAQSAIEAVQQWVYRPTLLNGEPVAALTTVDVNYTLSQ